jgi:hypothetical protein
MKNNQILLSTNKYLRIKKMQNILIVQHAASSARIEGVKSAQKRATKLFSKSYSLRSA